MLENTSGHSCEVRSKMGTCLMYRDLWFTESSVCKVSDIKLGSKDVGIIFSSLYSANFMTRETSSKEASWLCR